MAIILHHLRATQFLQVRVLSAGRANVPFLNWQVSAKAMAARGAPAGAFAGAGLYGVCFDDRLIYIGSFLGSGGAMVNGVRAATFVGDVARGRWWQHFGSITGRSHHLSVAQSTLSALEGEFGQAHPMVASLRGATPDITRDAGCLGALNRLRFAAVHFNQFVGVNVQPQQVLSRFCYLYAQIDSCPPNMNAHGLSGLITNIEHSLIQQYHPEVNTAGRLAQGVPVIMSCAQAQQVIGNALSQGLFGNEGVIVGPDNPSDHWVETPDRGRLVSRNDPGREPSEAQIHIDKAEAPIPVKDERQKIRKTPSGNEPPRNPPEVPPAASHEPDRRSARELFFASITGNHDAEELIAAIQKICRELNVEIHHTYLNRNGSGDLRIRARRGEPHSGEQNVITLEWRPKAGHFSCRCLIPPEQCATLGFHPDADVSPNVGQPLPTKLKARPGRDNGALLAAVKRSIAIYRGN